MGTILVTYKKACQHFKIFILVSQNSSTH